MIDDIRSAGNLDAGRTRPARPEKTAPSDPASPPGAAGAESSSGIPELRNRLAGVSGRLDSLLENLSRLQSRERTGADVTREREAVEHSIATVQVALQNILSANQTGDLPAPPGVPPGHDLDRQNILQLLGHE